MMISPRFPFPPPLQIGRASCSGTDSLSSNPPVAARFLLRIDSISTALDSNLFNSLTFRFAFHGCFLLPFRSLPRFSPHSSPAPALTRNPPFLQAALGCSLYLIRFPQIFLPIPSTHSLSGGILNDDFTSLSLPSPTSLLSHPQPPLSLAILQSSSRRSVSHCKYLKFTRLCSRSLKLPHSLFCFTINISLRFLF